MSSTTIKRQPANQRKRKCTRADPTQIRILRMNYDTEARPSPEQFADMSQKINLCVTLISFATFSESAPSFYFYLVFPNARRPVDWIKKWFLRKRKADSKNSSPSPAEPTLVENEPPADDGQTLGHAHSKFWGMGEFAAADTTNFSPSVGRIPRFYGHRKRSPPPVNADNRATDSRENEERVILPPGTPPETGYGYLDSLGSILACENMEAATTAGYNLREVLLGTDAFVGYVSPLGNGNTPTTPTKHPDASLAVDDSRPTLLAPASPSPELPLYPVDFYEGCSRDLAELELALSNHPVPPTPSPLDTIDDFFATLEGYDLISTTPYSTPDGLESGTFGSTTGCLASDLDPSTKFPNVPSYMMSILDEHSTFYDGLSSSQPNQDPVGDSTDTTNCNGLLGIDFCLGTGADHSAFTLTGFEFCE